MMVGAADDAVEIIPELYVIIVKSRLELPAEFEQNHVTICNS